MKQLHFLSKYNISCYLAIKFSHIQGYLIMKTEEDQKSKNYAYSKS